MFIYWMIAAYLLGSLPAAWFVSRAITGEDIRNLGSGNAGVMNTAVSITRWAGLLVFLAEIAKGLLAVAIPRYFGAGDVIVLLSALATVIGTRWSIWLDWSGGKGTTSGMAALLLLSWPTLGLGLILWLMIRGITRSHFVATRVSFFTMPLLLGLFTRSLWGVLVGYGMSLVYYTSHRLDSDDHTQVKAHYTNFWRFLISAPRPGGPKSPWR